MNRLPWPTHPPSQQRTLVEIGEGQFGLGYGNGGVGNGGQRSLHNDPAFSHQRPELG